MKALKPLSLLITLGALLLLAPAPASGALAEDAIVDQLLTMYLPARSASSLARAIAEAHADIQARARRSDTAQGHAIIIFAGPTPVEEIIRLTERYDLHLSRVRYTQLIGASDQYAGEFAGFRLFRGSLNEQFAAFEARFLAHLETQRADRGQQMKAASASRRGALSASLAAYQERRTRFLADGLDYYLMEVIADVDALALMLEKESHIRLIQFAGETTVKDRFVASQPRLPFPGAPHEARSATALTRQRSSPALTGRGTPAELTCGTAGDEACPPDATWLPAIEGADWSASSTVSWNPSYTTGNFDSQLFWSAALWDNPYAPGTVFEVNTSAFRGPPSLPACNPRFTGLDAPCSREDGIRVSNPSYESDGRVPNPACTLQRRSGTMADVFFGCFYHFFWDGNLPGAYMDTTIFDGPTTYSATVGAFYGEDIQSGSYYDTHIDFFSLYANDVSGLTLAFDGQVGTVPTFRQLCLAIAPGPEFCVFATDTTNLGTGVYE